jgi:hypothetical protein
MGIETCHLVWPKLTQKFRMANKDLSTVYPDMTSPKFLGPCKRASRFTLHENPVDFLIIGASNRHPTDNAWLQMVAQCSTTSCPRLIVELWSPRDILYEEGPMSKPVLVKWAAQGYFSHVKLINSIEVGGSVDQQRLLVARVYKGVKEGWSWPELPPQVCRPMSNCLRTHNIPYKTYQQGHPSAWTPRADLDPMPGHPGSLIETEKGIRRLLNDELGRGLGIPKSWFDHHYPEGSTLKNSTSLHIQEYLSILLTQPCSPVSPSHGTLPPPKATESLKVTNDPTNPDTDPVTFEWRPPKLDVDSAWYRIRFKHLKTASTFFDDPDSIVEEGIRMLAQHRSNYTETHPEPTYLRILWWEFPQEHWRDLKDGSSMNFLSEPGHKLTPNAAMTPEQTDIAAEFVDELVALGVMVEGEIVTNAPLFVLPKAGQPGQWRVLADMRLGGQNEHIGSDPTVFPKSSVILDQLYAGGYSAVVDASKFFYQFQTRPDERKYMGCIHPIDGRHLQYRGLPMGSGNSPSIAGRFGAAFLRLLRDTCPAFQGSLSTNTWWDAYAANQPFQDCLSHGRNLTGTDGLPAALVWAHCDDFLIHGPNLEKTHQALRQFLDLAVDVGMLCHPGKLYPPAHAVKYTGLIFDTTAEPALRIPEAKREKCLAMIDYLLRKTDSISRLSLAIVAGVLESVSDATPSRLGHTYLKSLYSTIHPLGWENSLPYYSSTVLSEANRLDLAWWRHALIVDAKRRCRGSRAGTLIPTFGDGSGTGTGGTLQLPGQPMRMWMGAWSPQIFHFSSNWKELRTLLATLQHAKEQDSSLAGTTFFYFTDNIVTYYIVSSGASSSFELHRLIVKIKNLELDLGCALEVVHVPGTTIITQGMDGLSRGIWCTPMHHRPDQSRLIAEIFAPVTFSPPLGDWACMQANIPWPYHWTARDWRLPWDPHQVFDQLTIWAPPPELAAQLLYALLQIYVERPLTTSFLVILPRVLQRRWMVPSQPACIRNRNLRTKPFAYHLLLSDLHPSRTTVCTSSPAFSF